MPLNDQQVRSLFVGDVHFPARFPQLGALEIREIPLPQRDRTQQPKARKSASPPGSIFCLEISELRPVMVTRLVRLRDVRSIFLPEEAEPGKLSLDRGEWLLAPQLEDEAQAAGLLEELKERVGRLGNRDRLGIAFVVESARVVNIVSITTSAEESCFIHDRFGMDKRDPCC